MEVRQRESDDLASGLEELQRETALLGEDLEAMRAQQQTQEKDALALDHEQRKLAEETRGPDRGCRWRGWNWSGRAARISDPVRSASRAWRW